MGNAAAVVLCLDLLEAAHVWDDLEDGDDTDAQAGFHRLAVDIPLNPFYQDHIRQIAPLIANAVLQWRAANVLERDKGPGDIAKAYMLRAGIYQVFAYVAWLVGGEEWARKISPEVWRLYGETPEGLAKELGNA